MTSVINDEIQLRKNNQPWHDCNQPKYRLWWSEHDKTWYVESINSLTWSQFWLTPMAILDIRRDDTCDSQLCKNDQPKGLNTGQL